MSLVNLKTLPADKKASILSTDKSEFDRIRSRSSMHKGVRPWTLVDVTADLDQSQPWIGMEWENGFTSLEKYQQVIDHVWAEYHGVTVDAEGPGPWYGEFTFSPTNLSDFNEGTTPFDGLLNYMHDNDIRMPLLGSDLEVVSEAWVDPNPHPERGPRPSASATWCGGCQSWHNVDDGGDPTARFRRSEDLRAPWGMHVNISMPGFRDATFSQVEDIGESMNSLLTRLNSTERDRFFGRDPYGWCYEVGSGDRYWWEFKLFRTTDDKDAIAGYKTVINGLVKMLSILIEDSRAKITKADMIRMLSGTYTD